MKQLLTILAIFLISGSVFATDITDAIGNSPIVITMSIDSSDTANAVIDADTSAIFRTGYWQAMSLRWSVAQDSSFADDSIFIVGQYSYEQGSKDWINIPGIGDTILPLTIPTGTDTLCLDRTITAVRDSFGLVARVIITHSFTNTDSATATDIADSTYNFYVSPYVDEVNK